jgi:hypothetical protein
MKLKAKQLLGFCCAPNKHLADLDCKTGPLPYEFADTAWELFSCSDNLSFVALPASGNPAAPFFFYVSNGPDSVSIYGEGSGIKKVTQRVVAELKKLDADAVMALINRTKQVNSPLQ